MKITNQTLKATFIKRLNRFEALINIDGTESLVHVPNTGRCKELLIEGVEVILEIRTNPKRKTPYELIMVYKEGKPVSIDSQAPNKIVEEAVRAGLIEPLRGYDFIKREYTYGDSRFDLFLKNEKEQCFVEVKGVTLERDGVAMFPDAPTERGTKHIYELIKARKEGYRGVIFFLIQLDFTQSFIPNRETDEAFAKALKEAQEAGVEILAYDCKVSVDQIEIHKAVPVKI